MTSVRRQVPPKKAALKRLLAAAATSSLGDGLMAVALPLLAVTLTTNPLIVSGLAVASGLPWLVVALPAGALTDRLDRRRLVVTIELGRALVVFSVAGAVLAGRIGLFEIYVSAFLIAVGETFVAAVTRSLVPLIVGDSDLASANGYVLAAETAGEQFAGPAIGGVVFGAIASLPFFGDAVSFIASAALLRSAVPVTQGQSRPPKRHSVGREIRLGLRWFIRHPGLRVLAAIVTTFALCQAMVFGVLVLFATRTLRLHPYGYGLLLAVAAIGDVAAGFLAGSIHARLGPFRTIAAAGLVAAAAYLVMGSTSSPVVAAVALTSEAFAATLGNVATLSARHRLIPMGSFGLINNAFRMCIMGIVPLGSVLGGGLSYAFGLRTTFLTAGSIQLAGLLVLALPLRSMSFAPRPGDGINDILSSPPTDG